MSEAKLDITETSVKNYSFKFYLPKLSILFMDITYTVQRLAIKNV